MSDETEAPPAALKTGCQAVLVVAGVTLLFLSLAAWSWFQSIQGHPL